MDNFGFRVCDRIPVRSVVIFVHVSMHAVALCGGTVAQHGRLQVHNISRPSGFLGATPSWPSWPFALALLGLLGATSAPVPLALLKC